MIFAKRTPSGQLGAVLVAALALLVAGGCKKDKKSSNRGLPAAKDWNAPVPGAAPNPGGNPHGGMGANPHGGMGGNPHGGTGGNPHGGTDVGQMGLQPPDPNRKIDPNKFLAGHISIKKDLAKQVKPGAVVFVSVKRADAAGKPTGAALAVDRLTLDKVPAPFKLTERNAMISGTQFAGEVIIVAWTDQDGDAMSKQSGDILGQVKAKIPAAGLKLVLDTVQP